jgi:hypothetical protein
MPRRRRSKSAAIRQVLSEHPEASVPDIISLLKQRRVRVTPGLVYAARARTGRESGRAADNGAGPGGGAPTYSADLIVQLKTLAQQAGGYKNLRQLVEVLGG